MNVDTVKSDEATHLCGGDHFVHAIEVAQEHRFPTARRADDGSDLTRWHVQRTPIENFARAEPCADVLRDQRSGDNVVGCRGGLA